MTNKSYMRVFRTFCHTRRGPALTTCINYPKESKKEGRDQESLQSSTTPDPGYQWANNKFTVRPHKREPRGQSFPSR